MCLDEPDEWTEAGIGSLDPPVLRSSQLLLHFAPFDGLELRTLDQDNGSADRDSDVVARDRDVQRHLAAKNRLNISSAITLS